LTLTPFIFLPFTQNILGQPIPEILDLTKLFIADVPMKKKKQKNQLYLFPEYFEIWDQKPPIKA